MEPLTALVAALICLGLGAMYAAAESAQLAITPTLLDEVPEERKPEEDERLLAGRGRRHLHCALLGYVCTLGFLLAILEAVRALPRAGGLAIAIGATMLLPVIGVRVFVRAWCAERAVTAFLATRRFVGISRLLLGWVTWPIERGLGKIGDQLDQPFPVPHDPLRAVVDASGPGPIEQEQIEMIDNILDLRGADVEEVMTPRTEMVMIDVDETAEAAIALALESGYSRIPAYEGSRDQIIGVLYVKDVLNHWGAELPSLRKLVRSPVVFVPESQPIGDTLRMLQARRVHLGIVIDEYGGTSGLVTIEDVVEEIVGEIEDEHDHFDSTDEVRILGPSEAQVGASVHIDDVNEQLDIDLPDEEGFETVGGLIFARLGRIPEPGERVELDDLELTVLEVTDRRITKVRIHRTGQRSPSRRMSSPA